MPFKLVTVGIVGQLLLYLVNVSLARTLSIEAFETYSSAAALFILMISFAPLGGEKLALRELPKMHSDANWKSIDRFLLFLLRRSIGGFLLIVATALCIEMLSHTSSLDLSAINRAAVLTAIACVPFGMGAVIGLEVLTALGKPAFAAVIFRLVAPSCVLAVIVLMSRNSVPINAIGAIAIWGASLVLASACMGWVLARLRSAQRRHNTSAGSVVNTKVWARSARPLWAYKVGFAMLGSMPVLYLDISGQSSEDIAGYAAAASVVGLMTVFVTSTNRYYASRIALTIGEKSRSAERVVKMSRSRWLVPTIVVLSTLIFSFSDALMRFFGSEFVDVGITPLRILTATAAISMLSALIPTSLKYNSRYGWALGGLTLGLLVQMVCLALSVPLLGATGAALSHFMAVCAMYVVFFLGRNAGVRREIKRVQS